MIILSNVLLTFLLIIVFSVVFYKCMTMYMVKNCNIGDMFIHKNDIYNPFESKEVFAIIRDIKCNENKEYYVKYDVLENSDVKFSKVRKLDEFFFSYKKVK